MTASALGAGSLDLTGHTFLVTGSTDGIGQHTALRLAAAGATVLVHGRSRQRTDAAAARVKDAAARGSGGSKIGDVSDRVYSYVADLADLGQVRELAVAVRAEHPGGIHTLINNAGVYSERMAKSADGFELTWAVNVTNQVITTSSISASSHLDMRNLQQERGFSAHSAYSASKLCNQVFTLKLARLLADAGSPVLANTLDPGTVNTKMLLAGWGRIGIEARWARCPGSAAGAVVGSVRASVRNDSLQGVAVRDADNTFQLATNPGGESGKYYVSGRRARPVSDAADPELQDHLWALWEQQTGAEFWL
ncbi:hypothetical protein MNEG_7280 [Monoraphidium neglectum]|uniref:Short-chain dehydrogenase/reductase SDR n=1 Tax=Monoraphidium neglectum TaxID=145388 RepID=A0A0D2N3P1_9CHLO|nr:hypothetical protein MNEG_7280 [Monoraphidium neglectum]KIZ00681.1 hypothetical protein MNEG_7280 [Monoraphidium neglectum]|eukprot:XP_013899700.1 hypothetical protein MNEG_7280 [Monoraphidium neglectum]